MRAQPPAIAQGTAWANARISWSQDKCSVSPIVLAVRGSPGGAVNTMALQQPLQLTLSAGSACSTGAVHQNLLGLAGLM